VRRIVLVASRFSLRLRLTVLAAGAAAVVLTLGALLLYGGLQSALDDAVTAELRVRADDVAAELQVGAPPTVGGGLLTQVLTPEGRVLNPPGASSILNADDLRAAPGELIVDRPVVAVGTRARLLLRPAHDADGAQRLVAVAGSTAPISRAQQRLEVVLGVAGPVMVMVVAAMAWLLTGAALRPVSQMTRHAAGISLREPDARLPQPAGRDEIAQLGRTLNAMLDRIADTMAHERAFVDNASHELRSPLAVLRSELELTRLELGEKERPAATLAALDSALEETDRVTLLTERLLVLARADAGRLVGAPEAVAFATLVRRVLERIKTAPLRIDVDVGDATAFADPVALEQLLTNLITNAARWARGRIVVSAARDGPAVVLVVADDGPGFDPQILQRPFDRFSRADAARGRSGGAGLGLAIVAAITEALGGQVATRNGMPLGGAVVETRLPAVHPASQE
jgi:two-component system OmpR family sensor kinase